MNTESEIFPEKEPLFDFNTPIVFIGSCFAENVEKMMGILGFNILPNEWGTHYNTHSIARTVGRMAQGKFFDESDVWKDERGFTTLLYTYHHAHSTTEKLTQRMNAMEKQCQQNIKRASLLILTLGLTEIYIDGDRNFITTNLNGIRLNNLETRSLSFKENYENCEFIYHTLKKINPEYKIVLTVSPVILGGTCRPQHHLISNSASKAILRAVADELCGAYQDIYYFPSFDIVYEEIRSWESYLEDRIHVSLETVEIIINRFIKAFFNNTYKLDSDIFSKIAKTYIEIKKDLEKQNFSEQSIRNCDRILDYYEWLTDTIPFLCNPSYGRAQAMYFKSSFLKKNGQTKLAIQQFETLIEYLKDLPDNDRFMFRLIAGGAFFHLGEIYMTEKNTSKARFYLEKCIQFMPEHNKAGMYLQDI